MFNQQYENFEILNKSKVNILSSKINNLKLQMEIFHNENEKVEDNN